MDADKLVGPMISWNAPESAAEQSNDVLPSNVLFTKRNVEPGANVAAPTRLAISAEVGLEDDKGSTSNSSSPWASTVTTLAARPLCSTMALPLTARYVRGPKLPLPTWKSRIVPASTTALPPPITPKLPLTFSVPPDD